MIDLALCQTSPGMEDASLMLIMIGRFRRHFAGTKLSYHFLQDPVLHALLLGVIDLNYVAQTN